VWRKSRALAVVIGSLLLPIVLSGTAMAATATYTHDSYFDVETYACTVNWKCTLSGGGGESSVNTVYKYWQGYATCTAGGPCRADAFQGHKPWGWGTAPYDMPRVNFVGGYPPWEKWVDISFQQRFFYCHASFECWEIMGLRIWADFNGLSACRLWGGVTRCSSDGVVELAILYGYEGYGFLACGDHGDGPNWKWQSSQTPQGPKSWWEYCYWAQFQNPNDAQWYSYTTDLTPILQSVSQELGRQPSEGYIFMFGSQVEDYKADGSFFDVTTLRFWGERGI